VGEAVERLVHERNQPGQRLFIAGAPFGKQLAYRLELSLRHIAPRQLARAANLFDIARLSQVLEKTGTSVLTLCACRSPHRDL
jgi:hypothetical protein